MGQACYVYLFIQLVDVGEEGGGGKLESEEDKQRRTEELKVCVFDDYFVFYIIYHKVL